MKLIISSLKVTKFLWFSEARCIIFFFLLIGSIVKKPTFLSAAICSFWANDDAQMDH